MPPHATSVSMALTIRMGNAISVQATLPQLEPAHSATQARTRFAISAFQDSSGSTTSVWTVHTHSPDAKSAIQSTTKHLAKSVPMGTPIILYYITL